jgi:hypothetical protein
VKEALRPAKAIARSPFCRAIWLFTSTPTRTPGRKHRPGGLI